MVMRIASVPPVAMRSTGSRTSSAASSGPLRPPARVPRLDRDVLAFDVAELAQAPVERLDAGRDGFGAPDVEQSDATVPPGLEGGGQEAQPDSRPRQPVARPAAGAVGGVGVPMPPL